MIDSSLFNITLEDSVVYTDKAFKAENNIYDNLPMKVTRLQTYKYFEQLYFFAYDRSECTE